MNWRRVWTGALIAGGVVNFGEFFVNISVLGPIWTELQNRNLVKLASGYHVPALLLIGFGIGLVLSWLYALVRPRLGPGPKTALLMGTIVWFLGWVPSGLYTLLYNAVYPAEVTITAMLGGLIECWVGIYLAGWQYIEKAP